MSKIYIVFEGSYSDRGVSAVFSKEELAKAYVSVMKNLDDPDVEIWDIDNYEFTEQDMKDGKRRVKFGYEFTFYFDGTLTNEKPDYKLISINTCWYAASTKGCMSRSGIYRVSVFAKNDSEEEYQRCLKVARDKRAKAKAEMEGL